MPENYKEKKIKLWVLLGGPSAEHQVSLSSGQGMIRALSLEKYQVFPVLIKKNMTWVWSEKCLTIDEQTVFDASYFEKDSFKSEVRPDLKTLPIVDLALLALHGRFGEDGGIQSLLDYYGIAYTGSGALASGLGMDKVRSKQIYGHFGLPTPVWDEWTSESWNAVSTSIEWKWGEAAFVKDVFGGSSLNMGRVKNLEELKILMEDLLSRVERVIVEPLVEGREFSCAYLEGESALPATEIIPLAADFFDFKAKYEGKSKEVTPANVSESVMAEMQRMAREAHVALALSGYSRTDFVLDKKNHLWLLETNTLPGFTTTSLLPQQANVIGLGYSNLVEWVVCDALARVPKKVFQ
jgi:D-alanine-D-alanine ligase